MMIIKSMMETQEQSKAKRPWKLRVGPLFVIASAPNYTGLVYSLFPWRAELHIYISTNWEISFQLESGTCSSTKRKNFKLPLPSATVGQREATILLNSILCEKTQIAAELQERSMSSQGYLMSSKRFTGSTAEKQRPNSRTHPQLKHVREEH